MGSLRHSWLEGLETPYLWRPSELLDPRGQTNLLRHLQDREQESRDNNKDLTFSNFVINLLLGYELFASSNDATAAMSKLGKLEMDLFRMDIVSNCSFYLQVRRAQWHTMLASRAVLLACLGRLEESRQVVGENFDPVSVFNSVEMAAICGIKSRVYLEYGPTAWPDALRWAREALKMNPKEAEWHFLAGQVLVEMAAICGIKSRVYLEYGPTAWPDALRWAREALKMNPKEAEWHFLAGQVLVEMAAICGIKSRVYLEYGPTAWPDALRWAREALKMNPKEAEWHFLAGQVLENIRLDSGNFTGIPKEEVNFFERAVALGGRGNHMVHLANVYDRLAQQVHLENFKHEKMDLLVKNLTRRSFELLQKTLSSAGNNTEIRLHCLKGLLRQPHRRLAKEDMRKFMEELLSEPKKIKMFFNVAGKYYLKLEKDNQTAIRYFEEGSELGDYACSVNALRLRHNLGLVPDPELALRHLVARYSNHTAHHEDALCHLGAWLMLGKRDLAAALRVFNTVLEHNPRCRALVVHKPIFVRSPSPLNLLHNLYNEVRLASAGSLTPQEKDNFLNFLATHNPAIISTPVDPQLLDKT